MLFDLRGRGRRRAIQVIYLTLAILMGGGLILFGIGGGTSGGLVDAITGSGGGGNDSTFEDRVEDARKAVAANPQDAIALASLVNARWQLAQQVAQETAAENDFETEAQVWASPEPREQLQLADRAWQRYIALEPADLSLGAAGSMMQVYSLLDEPEKAVVVAEALTEADPENYRRYQQLFELALQAGQQRKADLAYDKALELAGEASQSTRRTAKSEMDAARSEIEGASTGAGASSSTPPSATTGE